MPSEPASQKLPTLRDLGPYSTRNTSKGSLIEETALIAGKLASGLSIEQIRQQVLDGELIRQSARETRRTIWQLVHYRLLSRRPPWVIQDLKQAHGFGWQSAEFVSFVYLHYVLRDHQTFDFVTGYLWDRWRTGKLRVEREDFLSFLDQSIEANPQILRWSETSKRKLARNTLTSLRDFGLLKGTRTKELVKPNLPPFTAAHLLRILAAEGNRGREVLHEPTWKLFLLSPDDVAHVLSQLAQQHLIRFERVGTTAVLDTPSEWEAPDEPL